MLNYGRILGAIAVFVTLLPISVSAQTPPGFTLIPFTQFVKSWQGNGDQFTFTDPGSGHSLILNFGYPENLPGVPIPSFLPQYFISPLQMNIVGTSGFSALHSFALMGDGGPFGVTVTLNSASANSATFRCTTNFGQSIPMPSGVPITITSQTGLISCAGFDNSFFVEAWYSVTLSNLYAQFGSPQINIGATHFEQVIEDPQLSSNQTGSFDAVAGKSASFKIGLIGPSNTNSLPGSAMVQVKSGNSVVAQTLQPVPLSKFDSTGAYTITPNMMAALDMTPFKPTTATQSLSIQVVLSSDTTGVTAGAPTEMSLTVHQVTAPTMGFVQINSPFNSCPGTSDSNTLGEGCYLSPLSHDVGATLTSDKFMSAVYPVPDNSYTYSQSFVTQITGAPGFNDEKIFWQDYNQLELFRAAGGYSRMVGIVSSAYIPARVQGEVFDFANSGWTPLYLRDARGQLIDGQPKSTLVVAGSPESVPHEIGHTFGLADLYTAQPNQVPVYANTAIRGYDPVSSLSYIWPPILSTALQAISFMGPSGFNGGLLSGTNPYNNYWIDDSSYNAILSIVTNPLAPDPETIFVSGVLSENGQFTFGSSLHLPNGIATPTNSAGDVSVALLDQNGGTLTQVTLQSNFQAEVDFALGAPAGPSIVNMGAMPIDVQLPFSSAATHIQVSKNNIVLQRSSINGQLLPGIIVRIPDLAFLKPRECEHHGYGHYRGHKHIVKFCENYQFYDRRKLNEIVTVAQKELNSRHPEQAISTLNLLMRELDRLTSRNYTVDNSSQLTQTEVISQIKKIAESLEPSGRKCRGRK